MKTNHRRGFVDPGSFRDRSCETWTSKLCGAGASIGNDFSNGHRGHARSVRGAKTHIRHSDRRFNRQLAAQALREYQSR